MKAILISLSFMILVGCNKSGFPDFPQAEYLYQVDADKIVCGKFKIVTVDPFKIEYVEDVPLINCDGYVAMPASDFLKILNFKNDAKEWYEKHKSCF